MLMNRSNTRNKKVSNDTKLRLERERRRGKKALSQLEGDIEQVYTSISEEKVDTSISEEIGSTYKLDRPDIRVKIFSDFCSSSLALENYISTYCIKNNRYHNILFVDDNSYTHAIVLNKDKPELNIPKENVIGFAFEPIYILNFDSSDIEYIKNNVGSYYLGDSDDNFPSNFISGYTFMWHSPLVDRNLNCSWSSKPYIMSLMVGTFKKKLQGHRYRYKIMKKILSSDRDIHIYGIGLDHIKDKRILGPFGNNEIFTSYKYTIAIQNFVSNDFINEKFTDPLCFNCIPIYYGARNVRKVFGNSSGYLLSGNLERDIKLINFIYDNPDKYRIDLKYAQEQLASGKAYFPKFIESKWCRPVSEN